MIDNLREAFIHGIVPSRIGPINMVAAVPYVAVVGILLFILSIVPGLIWIERVVIAFMQDRSGPNRVGPRGLLQTLADGVKLFFKEEIQPKSVDLKIYYLAPVIAMIPALAGGGTLPLQFITFKDVADGHLFQVPLTGGNINVGLLYILALSSLQVYGVVLAGWASNNKYSLLGGLRAAAQLISYELAMGLSLLCVVVSAGSLNLNQIVSSQNVLPFPGAPEILRGSMFSWYWCQTLFVPFIIYTIAMIAETNRAPFDLPEAESELIAGFHTEYSSMKFAMFFMGEYASMLTVCGLNAVMFWGGSLPPINVAPLNLLPGVVWFVIKVMAGIIFYVWLRATLPRLRYDALMNLGWKRLLPVGLIWLFLLAGVNLVRHPNMEMATADTFVPNNSVDTPMAMRVERGPAAEPVVPVAPPLKAPAEPSATDPAVIPQSSSDAPIITPGSSDGTVPSGGAELSSPNAPGSGGDNVVSPPSTQPAEDAMNGGASTTATPGNNGNAPTTNKPDMPQ